MRSVITLSATGWFSNEQVVVVPGITRLSNVVATPDAISALDWDQYGIEMVMHGANTVIFTCQTTPELDIYAIITA